uniref:hypothetical protein n=1 Tax=Agrobacterium pusense TaxID=648995 RepID=UPI001AED0E7D
MKSLPYSVPMVVAGLALALSACSADGSGRSAAAAPCNAEAAHGLVESGGAKVVHGSGGIMLLR